LDQPDPFAALDAAHRRSAWRSVAVGIGLGILAAVLVTLGIREYLRTRPRAEQPMAETAAAVALFRLPAGGDHELYLVPAGPDGSGEVALSEALFPGEEPRRELASLLLANISREDDWDVDLDAMALACRVDDGDEWTPLEVLSKPPETLDPAHRLRLRSLGAGTRRVHLGPRSMKRVLFALPARRQFEQLSGVQWGGLPLRQDRLEVERLRRIHEDPVLAR